jgi:hypothetical protein
MRCFFGETERTGAGEENGGEEGDGGGGWGRERVGDEGVSEWTSGGGDWAGSEERKEGRPHGGAGGNEGRVSGGNTCVGKKSRGKDKDRKSLQAANVIVTPTDGMFTETDFGRPSRPGIPANAQSPAIPRTRHAEHPPLLSPTSSALSVSSPRESASAFQL